MVENDLEVERRAGGTLPRSWTCNSKRTVLNQGCSVLEMASALASLHPPWPRLCGLVVL